MLENMEKNCFLLTQTELISLVLNTAKSLGISLPNLIEVFR